MTTSSLIFKAYELSQSNDSSQDRSILVYMSRAKRLLKPSKDLTAPISNISTALNTYYLPLLENTNSILFPYMSKAKMRELRRELEITKLLLIAQAEYEGTHQKYENLHTEEEEEAGNFGAYAKKIKACEAFIDRLNATDPAPEGNHPSPIRVIEQQHMSPEQPVRYLGLSVGQIYAKTLDIEVGKSSTKNVVRGMSRFNEKRLYWVWGSSFIKTMLELIPADFFHTEQGKQTVRIPDPYTGCISWGLYYFRFAINLSLLLKHTIKGPWMSKEEGETPAWERFKTQWDQRKFALLNDSIWATGNLLCFFWLYGRGTLGSAGDLLTVALLVFDVSAVIWDFEEQRVKFNKDMLDYDTQITQLDEEIQKLGALKEQANDTAQIKEYEQRLITLQMQLNTLKKSRAVCQRDWNIQKVGMVNLLTYSVALLLAFTLLAMPFMPIAAPVASVLAMVGAVLCFAFTVINNAMKVGVEVYRAHVSKQETQAEYLSKIEAFKELCKLDASLDKNDKKLLFLEIKQLMAETEHQKRMVAFQTAHLIRAILIETLMPAIILVNLVFFPIGMSLGIIGAVIGLAIGTNLLLNSFKPEKGELKEFDEEEYACFAKECMEKVEQPSSSAAAVSAQGLFKQKPQLLIEEHAESDLTPSPKAS